jgi:hypothetical protein
MCWACAIGSRATLAPATILWGCLTAGASIRRGQGTARGGGFLVAALVVVPILMGCLALGWYNAERFGSPLEFGHRN